MKRSAGRNPEGGRAPARGAVIDDRNP
jgi:hypothetical protein